MEAAVYFSSVPQSIDSLSQGGHCQCPPTTHLYYQISRSIDNTHADTWFPVHQIAIVDNPKRGELSYAMVSVAIWKFWNMQRFALNILITLATQ
jgi:hypothetical protein